MAQPSPGRSQAAEQIALAATVLLGTQDGLPWAEQAARLAVAVDPTLANAHGVLAAILEERAAPPGDAGQADADGRGTEALGHRRDAARLAPGSLGHRLNLALALLARGDWTEGLPLHEARHEQERWTSLAARAGGGDGLAAIRARLLRPGQPLAGRRVLAFTEQGLGDGLWAARFLPRLAGRGARVTLACRPALVPVLRGLSGVAAVLSPPAGQADAKLDMRALAATGQHDLFVPIMSLPWVLGATPDGGGGAVPPYLAADPARVADWRARYRAAHPDAAARGRIVGLVWRASPTGPATAERSIAPALLAPLAAVPGLGWVSLQGGPAEGRDAIRAVLPGSFDALADNGGTEPPLDRFAAALAACDVLVSVDTMAAHLAGALGRGGLIALPTAPHFSFYWGLHGDSCPWYPSLRLFRQRRRHDWSDVIGGIAAALDRAGAGSTTG